MTLLHTLCTQIYFIYRFKLSIFRNGMLWICFCFRTTWTTFEMSAARCPSSLLPITPQLLFLSSWQLRPHSHRQHSITTPYFNSLNIWGKATPTHSLMKHWIFYIICLRLGRKRVVVNQNICSFYLRCCVEVSNSRTSNWQKFCLWNENVLSFFFAVSYSLDEGVSPIVLQLLQSAICPPTASTTSRYVTFTKNKKELRWNCRPK